MPLWDLLSGSLYNTANFHRQERPSTAIVVPVQILGLSGNSVGCEQFKWHCHGK
jgi:hypothetical protein